MIETREQWLNAATVSLRSMFKQHGHELPMNVKATCGFPSRGALSARKRTVGQCWDTTQSAVNVFETFVSPIMADSTEVLAILAHEMVHATVGLKCGHKKPFKQCATDIGLEGKMTATTPSDTFKQFAAGVVKEIGEYPHGALNPALKLTKQSTRLIKCECAECGYTVRAARSWLDSAGAPICPLDNQPMEFDN